MMLSLHPLEENIDQVLAYNPDTEIFQVLQ